MAFNMLSRLPISVLRVFPIPFPKCKLRNAREFACLAPRIKFAVYHTRGQNLQQPPGHLRRQAEECGMGEYPTRCLHPRFFYKRLAVVSGNLLPPLEELLVDVDFHRTNITARTAQSRRKRQIGRASCR